jgi:hypothetical protein
MLAIEAHPSKLSTICKKQLTGVNARRQMFAEAQAAKPQIPTPETPWPPKQK